MSNFFQSRSFKRGNKKAVVFHRSPGEFALWVNVIFRETRQIALAACTA